MVLIADMDTGSGAEAGPSTSHGPRVEEEYHFEVLSSEQIAKHLAESVREISSVLQVSKIVWRWWRLDG